MSLQRTNSVPLYRNRNYTILWGSRFISEIAGEIAYLAFSLLVLSMTASPWQLGIVASVYGVAQILGVVPAGVLADRFSRKTIMIVTEGFRIVALGFFTIILFTGNYSFAVMLVIVAVEGAFSAAFAPAEDAALPSVVDESQLVTALAHNTSRSYLATLLGPAVCGALFTVHVLVPFTMDIGVLGLSLIALTFLQLPWKIGMREKIDADNSARIDDSRSMPPNLMTHAGNKADGMRWVLAHPSLRATLFWVGFLQFFTTALVIIILSRAGESEASPGKIGFMMTFYGAGGFLGSFAVERLHRVMKPSAIIIGFSWLLVLLIIVMEFVAVGVPLGILLGFVAFFVPIAFTTIMGYQLAITPDGSRGRLSALLGITTGLATTAGPLLGALLIVPQSTVSPFFVIGAGLFVVAAVSTAAPSIRGIHRPEET